MEENKINNHENIGITRLYTHTHTLKHTHAYTQTHIHTHQKQIHNQAHITKANSIKTDPVCYEKQNDFL